MKGLLLKDFLVLTKQMKLFLILIPVMAATGCAAPGSIAVLLGAALPMTAMAYDEQSKWQNLAVMMPYSGSSIVFSKYALGYILMAGASVLFAAARAATAAFRHSDPGADIFIILSAVVCGLLLIAVNIPISLKFGVQKGRIVFIVFMGLVCAAGSILGSAVPEIPADLTSALPAAALLSLPAAAALNVLSLLISLRIQRS